MIISPGLNVFTAHVLMRFCQPINRSFVCKAKEGRHIRLTLRLKNDWLVCCIYDQSPVNTIDFMRWTHTDDDLSLIKIVDIVSCIDDQTPIHRSINSVFFKPNHYDWQLYICTNNYGNMCTLCLSLEKNWLLMNYWE